MARARFACYREGAEADMLTTFLAAHRDEILSLARRKAAALAPSSAAEVALTRGLVDFYDEMVDVFSEKSPVRDFPSAREHGRALARLGCGIAQIVHGYGAIFEAVVEAGRAAGDAIQVEELSVLNVSLDAAIADALAGFESAGRAASCREEALRLGFLAHELRNALASASVAHQLIKKGLDADGSTDELLERNLDRMRALIDRSLAEVRRKRTPAAERRRLRLIELIEEIAAAATAQSRARNVALSMTAGIDPALEIDADREMIVGALANLVQNAVKFTRPGGIVSLRGGRSKDTVAVEIEDECGGLPEGKIDELFQAFTQRSVDRSGLGLGLTISRRAVELNGGELSARDLPGKGCVFTMTLPSPSA